MAILSDDYDFLIATFNYYTNPPLESLFTPTNPFTWDKSFLSIKDRLNDNTVIPSLWDPLTSRIPRDFFQSGYGFGDNLELNRIIERKTNSILNWIPRYKHGTFYSHNLRFYLYSDGAATQLLSETLEDDRSRLNLLFIPKLGIPVSAQILRLDTDFNITVKTEFKNVSKFTGIVENGIELDTSGGENINTDKREFILHKNPNNIIANWPIPGPLGDGESIFTLPDIPLSGFKVIFSRRDIFINEIDLPLVEFGDYNVNYSTGEITVLLFEEFQDLGHVTFTWDYPAWLEFNDNYVEDFGSGIVVATPDDIPSLVRGPVSDGNPNQIISIGSFPVIDETTESELDITNFKLFVYDPNLDTFDNDWTRVRDFELSDSNDKHYVLDSERGTITFGDNINGKIPTLFHIFFFGLKTSVRVQYEPSDSTDFWTDNSRDIHPLHNTLSDGFLYLSRKELIPTSVTISFSVDEITTLESAQLKIEVLDREFEPVSGQRVDLTIDGEIGDLEDNFVITDSRGQAFTNYLPSSRVEDVAIIVHFFEPGPDSETPGDEINPFSTRTITNDTITLPQDVASAAEDIFLFKIYANEDPFNVYDHETRSGGQYIVYYHDVMGTNELIRPIAASGQVLIFDQNLPQPFESGDPEYEPNLRGYAIITKKEIQVRGSLEFRGSTIFSNIERLLVGYSLIQQGEWTLPIFPTTFTGSEIGRATWITLNP